MNLMRSFSAVLVGASLSLSTSTAVGQDLQGEVERLIGESEIRTATIAVSIRDADTDEHLAAVQSDTPMLPASNMKLLTSGAALHILGPEFEFRTKMILEGDRLIVLGDGDPGFGDPELLPLVQVGERVGIDVEEMIQLWINPLLRRDITHLSEIIVDDRIFDREFVHETWPREQLNATYCAEVAGFTFHLNTIHFYPAPIPRQAPDVSRFEPYLGSLDTTSNRATSGGGPQDGNTFAISRPHYSNRLTFFGNVKTKYVDPAPVTIHDMPQVFAEILADRLRRGGVTVGEARVANEDDPIFAGETIAPTIRTPISTIVTRSNRDSENLYAESLMKRAGRAMVSDTQPGSWSNGASAIRWAVQERLSDSSVADGLMIADGSGLSRENRVTAGLLTAWMDTFHRDPELGSIYIDSLAVGGVSGTLKKRFTDFQSSGVLVQGKSGFINDVSCLSGFITASDGRRRSFSILINGMGGNVAAAKQLQEAIVAAAANDLLVEKTIDIGG